MFWTRNKGLFTHVPSASPFLWAALLIFLSLCVNNIIKLHWTHFERCEENGIIDGTCRWTLGMFPYYSGYFWFISSATFGYWLRFIVIRRFMLEGLVVICFVFPGCMKEFNRPDKLKSHIISHSGIKPYKCPVCGKAFSRRPHMLEHERYHRNDYKFRCDACGRGYNREKLFKAHSCKPRVSLHRKGSRTCTFTVPPSSGQIPFNVQIS